ncbi:MAG TPA: DUF2203 domain-containing protein [Dehalococcoidia bacterium]|nr:DUF2203 domain-containing protein [Dehalococcoidia bacterium]
MPRYWTVEEARAALPEVIGLLEELRRALARQAQAGAAAGVVTPGARLSANGHGASRPDDPLLLARRALERINALGVQVKDVESGLIDFPHLRNGEEVLLCYRLGEADIAFWHGTDTGFAGRRPLSEL